MKKHIASLLLTAFALFSLLVFNACKKDDHDHGNEATIEITSPTEGQQFHSGETMTIKATLTGKETLHGWKIEIRKKSDGTVLFSDDEHTHGKTLTVERTWVNNVTEHTDLVVEVFAQLDHDGKSTSKSVNTQAHPM